MRAAVLILFLSMITTFSFGQEVWSLEKCVLHALDNSLSILQAQNQLKGVEITHSNLKQQRYPTLNANSSAGANFGRVINPATNDFETLDSYFNSVGLSTNITLYAGRRIANAVIQNESDLQATSADLRQAENDLGLSVALTYLNVLFAYENLTNAENQLKLTEQQLDQVNKFISAGSRPEAERYDILAQIATDEQIIVQSQNNVEINLLALKQLLLLPADYAMDIERPTIDVDELEALETYTMEAVYNAAVNNQPQIEASEYRMKSAEVGVDLAKGQLAPTISLSGSIATNWSDLAKQADGFDIVRQSTPGVFINDQPALFEVEQPVVTSFSKVPFFDQYDNNLGYGFRAGINIPLYNQGNARTAVERAKLNVEVTETANEQIKQQLKTDIQNAIASARATRKTMQASQKALDASEIAFTNTERRYELGTLTTFDYLNARTRRDNAEVNLLIAKYDYLFRNKVIEYYLGRGIKLR